MCTNCGENRNAFHKSKAIQEFQKGDTLRVLMLTLDTLASGSNLVEATHVLLLDPPSTDPEHSVCMNHVKNAFFLTCIC